MIDTIFKVAFAAKNTKGIKEMTKETKNALPQSNIEVQPNVTLQPDNAAPQKTVKNIKRKPALTSQQKNLISTGRFYTSNQNTFWDKLWNISKRHPWAAAGTGGALIMAPLVMRKLMSD